MTSSDVIAILESVLFASPAPLSLDKLRKLLPEISREELLGALTHLVQEYEARNGGIRLVNVAGGYQFRTPASLKDWVSRLQMAPAPRLSKAALETLAIIAYRQPVIRSEVEYLRGVDSGGTIRTLLDLRLIRVAGREEIPGRPLIYATSRSFLELFGIESLDALPSPEELGALEAPEPASSLTLPPSEPPRE